MKLINYQSLAPIILLLIVPNFSYAENTSACRLDSLLTVASSQAQAQVKPLQQAKLAAEISAKIVKVAINVGDKVAKGDILFSLDDREWQLQLKQLDATIQGIQARHKLAVYQLQQRNKLYQSANISEDILRQHKTEVASLSAELNSQHFQKQQIQLTLSKTKITAPFDGVIVQRNVSLGDWVNPGQPVASLLNHDKVEIQAFLDAQQLIRLEQVTEFELHINQEIFPVKQQSLLPMLDPDKNLRPLILKPTDKIPLPGSQGQLRWRAATQKLPFRYLLKRGDHYGLMLLVDKQAQFHQLPQALPGRSATIDLPPDTLIITTGFRELQPGDLVKNRGCFK
ncbi:MAG: efflux RND transporter periplasmic adaptor subunit [Pseudomonadota bacterium]